MKVLQTKSSDDVKKIKEMEEELQILREKLHQKTKQNLIDKRNIEEYEAFERERDEQVASLKK